MDSSRWLPILIQFGIGAVLGGVGLWAGLKSGYLDWYDSDDRTTAYVLVAGYIAFLLVYCLFTFYLPFVPEVTQP
jgi:hypothetical protein